MYKCPGCGAGLKFDPRAQALTCDHCGQSVVPADFGKLQYIMQATGEPEDVPGAEDDAYETMIYTCPNCGAEVMSTEETAVTFCSYCGESVLLEGRLEKVKKPNRVIPFKVTKEDCTSIYKQMIRGAIFAPSHMKTDSEIDRFRGIYMPYWRYSFQAAPQVSSSGKTEKRRGDYIYTDRYRLDREIDAGYDGIAYDAASQFSDNLSSAISPFNDKDSAGFHPAYLSGFYADVTDVDSSVYAGNARTAATDYVSSELGKDPAYARYGVSDTTLRNSLHIREKETQVGMYPVWFLSSRNRKGDRVSYAVVNGQTGKIAADLPISYGKYLIGSLLLAIPIFLILNLYLTLTPMNCIVISIAIAFIGLIILNRQLNRAYIAEHQLDDWGLLFRRNREKSKEKPQKKQARTEKKGKMLSWFWLLPLILFGLSGFEIVAAAVIGVLALFITICNTKETSPAGDEIAQKAPMSEKIRTLFKPVAGIILGFAVIAVRPVSDIYYYAAAAIIMLLTAWSVHDIVDQHNRQTMRPLPQFEARGGDR